MRLYKIAHATIDFRILAGIGARQRELDDAAGDLVVHLADIDEAEEAPAQHPKASSGTSASLPTRGLCVGFCVCSRRA